MLTFTHYFGFIELIFDSNKDYFAENSKHFMENINKILEKNNCN